MPRSRDWGFVPIHGESDSKLHRLWRAMRGRCSNPNHTGYRWYGARGITVCDRWAKYENFALDMGQPPVGHSLDRIDNDGPYSPDNCRWASRIQQANNKRASRWIEHQGRKQTVAQWSRELGIPSGTIFKRLRNGWTVERILAPQSRGHSE